MSLTVVAALLTCALLTPGPEISPSQSARPRGVQGSGDLVAAESQPVAQAPAPGPISNYHFESVQLGSNYGTPTWLAYDAGVKAFYVAQSNSTVAVIPSGSLTVSATISVGASPFGVAYDPEDGRIFVADSGANTVSVISDANDEVIGSVTVGWNPYGVAYDSALDRVYVANGGSDSVSVFNASTLDLVTTIAVGEGPIGIGYNPVDGNVYVANGDSANVSVISGLRDTVVNSVPVGTAPYGVAVDNLTGAVFVSNSQSGNVSYIVDGTAIPIATGGTPQGLAYDWRNDTIWVADGAIFVVVIDASNHRVVQDLLFDPRGAAYNPDNNEVCVTNAANGTFQCLVAGRFFGYSNAANITFTESGLPTGTRWAVTFTDDFGSSELFSRSSTIQFQATLNFYPGFIVAPVSGYAASPSSGLLNAYRGGANISIAFTPAPGTYVLTVLETGLVFDPYGASYPGRDPILWGVALSGPPSISGDSALWIAIHNGTFSYIAANVPGFWTPPPGSITVQGGDRTLVVNYTVATYAVTFVESGLARGQSWGVRVDGDHQTSTAGSIVFQEPNGTYAYTVDGVDGYLLTTASGSFTVTGGGLSEGATFSGNPFSPVGLSPMDGYLLFGAVGILVAMGAAAGILLYRRARSRKGRIPPDRSGAH